MDEDEGERTRDEGLQEDKCVPRLIRMVVAARGLKKRKAEASINCQIKSRHFAKMVLIALSALSAVKVLHAFMDINRTFFVNGNEDTKEIAITPLQQLVNQYFDGVIVETPKGNRSEPDYYPSLESTVIKCNGDLDFNATCLFSNIYVREGSTVPWAYVVKGSESARRFEALPDLQLCGYSCDLFYGNVRNPIAVDEFETKDQLIAATKNATLYPTGLTAGFAAFYPVNIGHGIFDGIWGIFVGLVRMGLKDDAPFHPLLLECRWGSSFGFVSDIFRAASLENSLSACKPPNPKGGSVRFPLFALGNGHIAQRSMNPEYELPGGRIALRKFRDRVFSSLGIQPRKDHTSCPRKNTTLRVNIFHNKRYSSAERSVMEDVIKRSKEFPNISVRYVDWSTLKTTKDQIKMVADTDVYVSGPGTGLMLSTFLNDGSVVLNLGQMVSGTVNQRVEYGNPFPSYMEEYIVAGSPHLRALYYDRCSFPEVDSQELLKLILEANDMVKSCFNTTNAGYYSFVNKSPTARAYTEFFQKMSVHVDSIPKATIVTADWAEDLIYEAPYAIENLKKLGWDNYEFSEALKEAREENEIVQVCKGER